MKNISNKLIDNSVTDEVDFIELLNIVWSQRWFILKFTSVLLIGAVVYLLIINDIYKATVTILPQSKENSANKFSSLAALAGFDINATDISNEAFYGDFLISDKLLSKLVKIKWETKNSDSKVLLSEFLDIEADLSHVEPEAYLEFETKKYIRKNVISFNTNKNNGLMTLSVSLPGDPKLSATIANWLISELREFNESYRQRKALENVTTVVNQLDKAKNELIKAENNLNEFQLSNKNFLQSAELQLKYARLEREVLTENTVYTELRKQYEIAKIDLEKSKETIVILDIAKAPLEKDKPKRFVIFIICLFLAVFLSIILSLIKVKFLESKSN